MIEPSGKRRPGASRNGSAKRPIYIQWPALALRHAEGPSIYRQLSISIGTSAPKETEMPRERDAAIKKNIRRQQLREIVPLADSTIYEMEQRGEFPRRFALTPRCVVWDLGEVQAWLAARRSKPIVLAPGPDVNQRRTRPVKGRDPAPRAASTRA